MFLSWLQIHAYALISLSLDLQLESHVSSPGYSQGAPQCVNGTRCVCLGAHIEQFAGPLKDVGGESRRDVRGRSEKVWGALSSGGFIFSSKSHFLKSDGEEYLIVNGNISTPCNQQSPWGTYLQCPGQQYLVSPFKVYKLAGFRKDLFLESWRATTAKEAMKWARDLTQQYIGQILFLVY